MQNIKSIIQKNTGLCVEVLTYGYDDIKKLHYACCLYGVALCYFEITEDETQIIFCTDDKKTLEHAKTQIEKSLQEKNKHSDITSYNNVLYNSTNNTQYYMYRYMLRFVAQ